MPKLLPWSRLALLAVPFVVTAIWTRSRVPRWGDAIAHAIYDVVGAPPKVEPVVIAAPPPEEPVDAGIPDAAPAKRVATARIADAAAEPADDGGTLTLFVPAAVVQKTLDDHASRIRGRTARNEAGKPIGVRLTGINAAGVGIRDGDLIVAIDGTPTPDDDVATDAALSAVAKGKNRIKATLLRGSRQIDLTLELPEVDVPKR